ncbi:hypothetical protein [Rhodobacter maris]|uniref:Uncharacterized protein n=1 Tax=Rhodobacter maris TaxID=446682 RepID=A0A285SD99_9RHOB|nr:hypothetical protein [Rhodobacter maris]SOC05604.1 hypothetical protein SAMN05877831_104184 [Rhodobacter maris]
MGRRPEVSLLNRLARENKRMGQRLAQLEFRELLADLENPALFDLRIDFGTRLPHAEPFWPDTQTTPLGRRLPPLEVPLGKIAWVEDPKSLPVIAIHVSDRPENWRDGFRDLMKQHATAPFARPVFLCASLRPVPFLGRYGFANEFVGPLEVTRLCGRIAARYGCLQIVDLFGGNKLWPECVNT